MLHSSRDTFAIKEWLAGRWRRSHAKDASLQMACTAMPSAASAQLDDGRLVSFALSVEAFAEDCARAAVVVSARAGAGRLRRHC